MALRTLFGGMSLAALLVSMSRPAVALTHQKSLSSDGADKIEAERISDLRDYTVTIFIAIFSRGDNVRRRDGLRAAHGQVPIKEATLMKFVLCRALDEKVQALLDEENQKNADMLFVECDERARNGSSARAFELLKAFYDTYRDRSVLAMAEEDTFVAWRRLRSLLHLQAMDLQLDSYMGMPMPAGLEVQRDPSSVDFQPVDGYAEKSYPAFMEKPLVIMGRGVVTHILQTDFASEHLLTNWEQALGVWVAEARLRGVPIYLRRLPGLARGSLYNVCNQTWQQFPFIWAPNLGNADTYCMASADATGNQTYVFGDCLSDCSKLR